jgi:dihydrodipicolinate synthase/N-acetylneuraminate lyase
MSNRHPGAGQIFGLTTGEAHALSVSEPKAVTAAILEATAGP